jgi:hypothetical protein
MVQVSECMGRNILRDKKKRQGRGQNKWNVWGTCGPEILHYLLFRPLPPAIGDCVHILLPTHIWSSSASELPMFLKLDTRRRQVQLPLPDQYEPRGILRKY